MMETAAKSSAGSRLRIDHFLQAILKRESSYLDTDLDPNLDINLDLDIDLDADIDPDRQIWTWMYVWI